MTRDRYRPPRGPSHWRLWLGALAVILVAWLGIVRWSPPGPTPIPSPSPVATLAASATAEPSPTSYATAIVPSRSPAADPTPPLGSPTPMLGDYGSGGLLGAVP